MKKVLTGFLIASLAALLCFCLIGCAKKTVYALTYESGLATNYIYTNHEYDKSGNLISVQRNEATDKQKEIGNTDVFITYEYRSDGTLEKETRSHEYDSLYTNYVEEFTYDERGNEIRQEDGKTHVTFTTVNSYEGDCLVSSITTSDSSQYWCKHEYAYSEDGKKESEAETTSYDGGSTIKASYTTTFTYDENGNVVNRSVQQTYNYKGGSLSNWVDTLTYEEKTL